MGLPSLMAQLSPLLYNHTPRRPFPEPLITRQQIRHEKKKGEMSTLKNTLILCYFFNPLLISKPNISILPWIPLFYYDSIMTLSREITALAQFL